MGGKFNIPFHVIFLLGEPGGDNTPRDKLTAGSGGSSSDAQVGNILIIESN